MSPPKVPLEVLIDSLLEEASQQFQESHGLKWEWDHFTRIFDLLSKIREREAGRDKLDELGEDETELKRRTAALPTFIQWLQDNGVDFSKIDIVNINQSKGFGVNTKLAIKQGEVVFSIPKKLILTSEAARTNSKLKPLTKDPILKAMQNIMLAIFLVYEKYVTGDKSFWKPFISMLPSSFDTIFYFGVKEFTILKQSPRAFREALRMLHNVSRQYAYFHSKFRKCNDVASRQLRMSFTFNRYAWAVSAVTTRLNHIPNPEGEEILSLIPLWDLCNHEDSELLSTDYNETDNTLVCYASHDYKAKQEFQIYYGVRSSIDFLVHNGFVPEGSYRDDFYVLDLGISINDSQYARKKAILGHFGMECQSSFSVKHERISSTINLFLFVNIFQANKDDLDKIEADLQNIEHLKEPTKQSWQFLSTRFALLKRALDNGLESTIKSLKDKKVLEQEELPNSVEMVIQLLRNEQKLLDLLIIACNEQLKQSKDASIT